MNDLLWEFNTPFRKEIGLDLYYEDMWLNGQFPVLMWNVVGVTESHTNNHVEGIKAQQNEKDCWQTTSEYETIPRQPQSQAFPISNTGGGEGLKIGVKLTTITEQLRSAEVTCTTL